jgi:hypothetical protein
MKAQAVLSLAVAAALATAPARAAGEFSSGAWSGAAFLRDARFTHCAMRANLSGWKVAFSMDAAGAVNLGLRHRDLKFTKGKRLPATLQLDGGAPVRYQFVAPRRDMIGARLGGAEALRRFASARRLIVRIGEVRGEFNMSGLQAALAQLSACVAKRGRR